MGDSYGDYRRYTLNLFKSTMDFLLYVTPQRLNGKEGHSENLLLLAGVYKAKAKI